jgi:hypothetical protein
MAQLHPYEHVYFNWLAGPKATLRQRFEADYWGTSYLAGLRWLLANDPRERIPVYVANDPGWVNAYMLTPAEARRIAYVRVPEQADYVLTTSRWHREDYDFDEVFAVTAGSQKILAVYRLPWGAAAKTAAAPEHDRLR